MNFFFSALLILLFCILIFCLPFIIQPKRSLLNMSIEKQMFFIEKKYQELEKSAEMFERDQIIEICVCKRSIRRKNSLAASKSARKCIELYYKSRVYAITSYRIKNFLEFVNNAVTTGQLKQIKDMKSLISNIEHGLSIMSFDMLDLYLDSFENSFGSDEKIEKHDILLNVNNAETEERRPSENCIASSKTCAHRANRKKRSPNEKSEKEVRKGKHDKQKRSFESSLKMFKPVPDDEVDQLVARLAEEVKEEEVAFLYRSTI